MSKGSCSTNSTTTDGCSYRAIFQRRLGGGGGGSDGRPVEGLGGVPQPKAPAQPHDINDDGPFFFCQKCGEPFCTRQGVNGHQNVHRREERVVAMLAAQTEPGNSVLTRESRPSTGKGIKLLQVDQNQIQRSAYQVGLPQGFVPQDHPFVVVGNNHGWATHAGGYRPEYPIVVAAATGLMVGSSSTTSTVGGEITGVSQGQAGVWGGWNVGMHVQDQEMKSWLTLRVGDGRQVVEEPTTTVTGGGEYVANPGDPNWLKL
ncbi:hypothetical protein Dimus_001862 [Dionaea muscipula]